MTTNVSITLSGPTADDVRSQMHVLLGLVTTATAPVTPIKGSVLVDTIKPFVDNSGATLVIVDTIAGKAEIAGKTETTKRPSGRTRATAAEKAAEQDRQISTNPEDRQETDADKADAADEAADAAGQKEDTAEVTPDNVRNALGLYVKKFGMAAAQEDGPKCIGLAMKKLGVELPKGETAWKISAIPEKQEALKLVIAGVVEMIDKNPFSREPVPEPEPAK